MRPIYVAACWRTPRQPEVVAVLRTAGFEVYDFRHPEPGDNGFAWAAIDPNWQTWTPQQYLDALKTSTAKRAFSLDMAALSGAALCVLVQPSGRSAALELGWAAGAGKPTAVLLAPGHEPELMLRMASLLTESLDEIVVWAERLRGPTKGRVWPAGIW